MHSKGKPTMSSKLKVLFCRYVFIARLLRRNNLICDLQKNNLINFKFSRMLVIFCSLGLAQQKKATDARPTKQGGHSTS